MSNVKTLTTLELISDRGATSARIAGNHQYGSVQRAYRDGEAIAYSDAHKIMRDELRRLCNRFQNGYLSVDDFGVTL